MAVIARRGEGAVLNGTSRELGKPHLIFEMALVASKEAGNLELAGTPAAREFRRVSHSANKKS